MEKKQKKLKKLDQRRRETLPLSDLIIGMQCGGDVTVLFEYVSADDLRWSLLAGAVCDRIERASTAGSSSRSTAVCRACTVRKAFSAARA